MHEQPFSIALLVASFGPFGSGGFAPSLPLAAFPPVFTADSFQDVFVGAGAATMGLAVADANGYGTWTFANPNNGAFVGVSFVMQAVAIAGNQVRLSNPVLTQMR
jgi:hypothetical protein